MNNGVISARPPIETMTAMQIPSRPACFSIASMYL